MATLLDSIKALQERQNKRPRSLQKIADNIRLETVTKHRVAYIIDDYNKLCKEVAEVLYSITNRFLLVKNIIALPKEGVKGEDILEYNYIEDDSVIVIYKGGIFHLSTLIKGIFKKSMIYRHDHDIVAYTTMVAANAEPYLTYIASQASDNRATQLQVAMLTYIDLVED